RVMSPTLALIVQREAEIDTFKPVPFYTVTLELPGFTVSGERMADKADAQKLKTACQGATATVKKVERKDKSEKPPALYDLTTLQRDANRLLGYTAQQTLDYLQNLYEKKLCTYPRTDSRYLTSDMAESLPVLVNLVANAMPFRKGIAISCDAAQVINDKKVTDHHAVIPTRNLQGADLSGLPVGEKAVLELVALRLLCAVAQPYTFAETAVVVECAGAEFTAKGRTVKNHGWRALDAAYRAGLKNTEPDKETEDKALPELMEGQSLPLSGAAVKEGKTTPPKHFTEDTLLSAMETAGKEDMPDDAERKGLGTPATRAGILEKLVSTGFLERKKSKKTVQLMPSHDAVSLITVLPEQLQSPLLTAEWEYRLGEIERGELTPEDFMDGISTMLKELVGTYQVIKGTEYLFTPPREVVGKCPRCGSDVVELQKGFFCQNEGCKFAIWKNNKWWAAKKKQPTKAVVTALLKDGRARITGCYSEKTGKTYDATVVLEDDGQYANFKLEFDQQKGGKR
ncbi:MAG: DNA topoisomerase, partial [Dysosmobacter sp.]|nr:DNA topoisomerase [Dysosmobacter sp.]